MAVAYQVEDSYQAELTGKSVTVGSSNIARLMYYLSCVDNVLPSNEKLDYNLINYQNASRAENSIKKQVMEIVQFYNPKKMSNRLLFLLIPNGTLRRFNNDFLKLTNTTQLTVIGLTRSQIELLMAQSRK